MAALWEEITMDILFTDEDGFLLIQILRYDNQSFPLKYII